MTGTDQAPLLRVDPRDNILIGVGVICKYLGVSSPTTLHNWIELYGFPALKRPDSRWMTTMTAIDQWIFLACELDRKNKRAAKAKTRGTHGLSEIARRAERIEAGENPTGSPKAT